MTLDETIQHIQEFISDKEFHEPFIKLHQNPSLRCLLRKDYFSGISYIWFDDDVLGGTYPVGKFQLGYGYGGFVFKTEDKEDDYQSLEVKEGFLVIRTTDQYNLKEVFPGISYEKLEQVIEKEFSDRMKEEFPSFKG